MAVQEYSLIDLHYIAAGAAILASGRGFSNATDDLARYFDPDTGKSTGWSVSIIKVEAAPKLCRAPGVATSFAGLLRKIGYSGALPCSS